MAEPSTTGDGPPPLGPLHDRPIVPGYEILEELGRGGMGVVYKARELSQNRLVALKLIRDGALAGPQERARFRIEAEVAGRMRHPHFVQLFSVGEHHGQTYFAMELVKGGSLDKKIAGQPQPAIQAAELTRTLALAIQHAHTQQVIHRDLKPANILLMGRDEPNIKDSCSATAILYPKITDFGLAKRLNSDSTAWTQDGAVLGTASYMSPEQAAGRVKEIGPAADIYALGAILFELLTGRPPFQADSWNQVIQKVLNDDPTPPTRLHPGVPADLETICLKCLEKEPRRRYESAAALADDLGRFLEVKPLTAVALSREERLARLAGRDGYEIVREIGRGPRSIVYLAHYGSLQQPLALKVFHPEICTREDWEARLRRGAEQWAMLAHPQVIAVQRAGWWDGAAFLAMEYVAGGALSTSLNGKLYPVLQSLHLVAQLAEIVSYLHRQGAVHGNLKPSNVLLAADGIPRLVDFRLTAGLTLDPSSTDDTETAGMVYLAPELVRDPASEPRFYTDIYGLGLILYELLTGRPPFAGENSGELLEFIRSQEPAPPTRFNSQVTPELESFCMQCLAKNPWRRHDRAYNVQTRLRQFHDTLGSWAAWKPAEPVRHRRLHRGTKS